MAFSCNDNSNFKEYFGYTPLRGNQLFLLTLFLARTMKQDNGVLSFDQQLSPIKPRFFSNKSFVYSKVYASLSLYYGWGATLDAEYNKNPVKFADVTRGMGCNLRGIWDPLTATQITNTSIYPLK